MVRAERILSRAANRSLVPAADRIVPNLAVPSNWFTDLWRTIFGCCHKRTTFPITLARRTYVVCLDCGEEFAYSWTEMKIGGRRV
jgi:hypothetical protein